MGDKNKNQELGGDGLLNYQNKIKEKMKEIDEQIKTEITIPQYSKHFKKQVCKLPRYYYRENKEHYMSVFEHLCKKYEVEPTIYSQLDINDSEYQPKARHVYPYSQQCAQCNHYPVYLNKYDPFRPNPPVLENRCNENHLRRWIEFTELNENDVIREEIQEEWDTQLKQYTPFVVNQTIMNKNDALKLKYLMSNVNFVYDDFVGNTPNYIQSQFIYDQPICSGDIDTSFARMVQYKEDYIKKKQFEREEEQRLRKMTKEERKQEDERVKNIQLIKELQDELKRKEDEQNKINQQLKQLQNQNIRNNYGYSIQVGGVSNAGGANYEEEDGTAGGQRKYINNENQRDQSFSQSYQKQQRQPLRDQNSQMTEDQDVSILKNNEEYQQQQQSSMSRFETKFGNNAKSKTNLAADQLTKQSQNNNNNVTFNNNALQERDNAHSQQQQTMKKQSSRVLQPPSLTDIQKRFDEYNIKPSQQEFNQLKSFNNQPENEEEQKKLRSKPKIESSSDFNLKTFKPSSQTQTASQQQIPIRQSANQINLPSKSQKSFNYIGGMSSLTQFNNNSGSKKYRPSNEIKLNTRNQIKNDDDEYYPHNQSITHEQDDDIEYEAQIIKSQTKFIDEREAKIQAINQRTASQVQFSQQFDSHIPSLNSLNQVQQLSGNVGSHTSQKQIFEQVIQDVYDESTPANQQNYY